MDKRGTRVTQMINALKADSTFVLVRPYQGEIDRYRKISQLQEGVFNAEVGLTAPFALVISKERPPRPGRQDRGMKLVHHLSVYIGCQNLHEIGSVTNPAIYDLLEKAVTALRTINGLTLVNEGIYLVTTATFHIYDQQWVIDEVAY
jgi:hypothetical protein